MSSTDEELDTTFARMTIRTHAGLSNFEWILDSGATDHMTHNADLLCDFKNLHENSKITLLNGSTTDVSYVGKVSISAQIILQDVLYVLAFKYNLLSIPKLIKDSHCIVIFHPRFCIIQDYAIRKILGIGREHRGLYYLKDQVFKGVDSRMESIIRNMLEVNKNQLLVVGAAGYSKESESFEVWHKRLGHDPLSKLRNITDISLPFQENKACVTCPMAKLTKQPF